MDDNNRKPASRTEIENEIKRLTDEAAKYDSPEEVRARHRVRSDALLASNALLIFRTSDIQYATLFTSEEDRWVWGNEELQRDGFSRTKDSIWWRREQKIPQQ